MIAIAARPLPPDGPARTRLAGAMAVSLALHALLISLQFGAAGIGLPSLELPWHERRAQAVDLQVALTPAAPSAEEASHPLPAVTGTPSAGLRLVPLPPAPKAGKPSATPRPASRPPRPRIKRETPVIALKDTRDSRFNLPEASPEAQPETELSPVPEPAAAPESELAVREREQAEAEKALRARLAEEEAARQQQQAEVARKQEEEAARQRALALEETKRREEAERLALEEERRKADDAARRAALAQQQQREEALRLEREEAARRAMELEEKQRAETQRLQAERAQREAMELQARKLAEAAEAARQQALARERERLAEELAARRRAEAEAASAQKREPELVLGDSPAPGTRPNALPRDLGGGLASRALEQARRGDALRNDAPAVRQPESATDQPRRRSILGGKDVDVGVMMYVEGWRLKIERNGSIMYPRAAAELAHRDPVVTVAVRSDGSVENVVIHQSSGRPELDEAVYRIVRVNARYSAFPPELARRFDVIEIRRVWNFDERLRIMEEVR